MNNKRLSLFAGTKVICIDNQPRLGRVMNDAPEMGRVYTVSKIGLGHFGEVCISLRELKRKTPGRWGFGAWRFVPAPIKPKKQPKPKKEKK